MKVLITGTNSYIGTSLLPVLLEKGHDIVCLVRNKRRFKQNSGFGDRVKIITGDLLKETSIEPVPPDIDAAYYLVHSLAATPEFSRMEALSAHNFIQALNHTQCKQLIFLGDTGNADNPSQLKYVLPTANAALTVLRASIIIGAGSPSFEIIRALTEKFRTIAAPRQVKTHCQPIAISDVLAYLEGVLLNTKAFNQNFDIGGPDLLSFKELILVYAEVKKLNRKVIVLPFLSSKLSAYWLHRVTQASYPLAQNLFNTMQHETIMKDHRIDDVVPRRCLTYREALALAMLKKSPDNAMPGDNGINGLQKEDEIIKKM